MTSITDKEDFDLRENQLQHLERLYSLAQVLTVDAQEAVKLVEATYDRAQSVALEKRADMNEKAWLLRLMLQIYRSPSHLLDSEISSLDVADETVIGADTLHEGFRRRLVEQLIDRALPAVFVMLPEQERLLLMLCEVDLFSCEEAADILGSDPESALDRLEEARNHLTETLLTNATALERYLLDTHLPPNWQNRALRTLDAEAFLPLPPTLRPAILSSENVIPGEQRQRYKTDEQSTGKTSAQASSRSRSKRNKFKHFVISSLVIAIAGLLAYTLSSLLQKEPDTNLLTLSAGIVDHLDITFRTNSPEQAERYVYDRLDWRLIIPGIDQTTLVGVCISEIVQGIEVPVFLFNDVMSNERITLFVYSYALLDQLNDRVALGRDILRQIEESGHFDLYDLDAEKVLVWRNQDEIYIAVTTGDAETLRQRIFFPS